jgi:glycosyltransferase involved in cell wall biosynthesis
MGAPLVSVVIVVCNFEHYLGEAIESIVKQSFTGFELIVLDFGSTDRSKQIAAGFAATDSRIRLHEIPNCSLVEARNAGCSLAQGKYIAVMDADDVSLSNRLQGEVDFIDQHPLVGLVGGAAEWIDATGRSMWVLNFPARDQEIKEALLTHFPFCHSAVLMRRELFRRVGGYRPVFTASHDYDLCLRISEQTQCANLPQIVVKYRVHGSQVSLSKRKQQTFCKLAAQVSASSRKSGNPDPLNSVQEITPELLLRLGVSEASQQADLASDYQRWIQSMSMAGEASVALKATEEALHSNWKFVGRNQIADLNFTAARLYWKQKHFFKGMVSTIRAVILQPVLAKRLVGPVLRRLHLV